MRDLQGDASELLTVIAQRASHEVRNALNAIAVNVEVVRSRLNRPDPVVKDILTFAERASHESDSGAALATGLADLTRLFARAVGANGTATVSTSAGIKTIVVPICSADDSELSTDLKTLAGRIGVEIKLAGTTVIFTLPD